MKKVFKAFNKEIELNREGQKESSETRFRWSLTPDSSGRTIALVSEF